MKIKNIAVLSIAILMAISFAIAPVFATTTWQTTQLDTYMPGLRSISIAVDSSGNSHIAYVDAGGQMQYSFWTGTEWDTQAINGVTFCEFLSLVLDSSGNPHISYSDANGYLCYASLRGSTWTTQTVDASGFNSGWDTSLAFDHSGNPHISYLDWGKSLIKYASWTGSAWSIQTVASVISSMNTWTSLAFDVNGNPHICYDSMIDQTLEYASLASTWTATTIDTTDGQGISLAFNPQTEKATVSYYDAATGSLKLGTQTGSTWSIQIVDAAHVDDSNPGQATSLAFDPRCGNPAIAYYDAANGNLKYAYLTNAQTWNIEVADTTQTTGTAAALAFDSTGTPHIAYCANIWDEDAYESYTYLMYTVGSPSEIGTFKLPESPLGTGMALAISFIALAGLVYIRNKKSKLVN